MEDKIFKGIVEFVEKKEVFYEFNNSLNYDGLSISEVHCMEKIGKLDIPNASNIAKNMKNRVEKTSALAHSVANFNISIV